jgi:hypothetical protein
MRLQFVNVFVFAHAVAQAGDIGLCDRMGEYENIDELNYLASLLDDMEEWEVDTFSAAVEYGEYTRSVKNLINLAQNLDCYDYYPGVHNNEDLGYYYIDDLGMMDIPDHVAQYFDYEAFGRDMSINEGGIFAENGYIIMGGGFTEHYSGREDLPDEYRIFAYPDTEKMNMRDRLNMYQQMASSLPTTDRADPKREDRA